MSAKQRSRDASHSRPDKDVLLVEFAYLNDHIDVIHNARDRFFTSFLTVNLGLYGLLGLLLGGSVSPTGAILLTPQDPRTLFVIILVLSVALFGLGTMFILAANGLSRDYYRQRRALLLRLLLSADASTASRQLENYLAFSRDQVKWKFRITSIYTIYSVFVATVNSANLWVMLLYCGHNPELWLSYASASATIVVQMAGYLLYLRMYTRTKYPE